MKTRNLSTCYLTVCGLFIYIIGNAQDEFLVAKNYLKDHAKEQKLSLSEIDNLMVSSEYFSATTGLYHIYLNQTAQGIDVYNGLLSLTLKDKEVLFVGNSVIENLNSKLPKIDFKSLITPTSAIQKAALSVNLNVSKQLKEMSSISLTNTFFKEVVFTDHQLSDENILVRLYWYASNEKGIVGLHLVWEANIYEIGDKHNWSVKIDAISGKVLDTKDHVVHYPYGETTNKSVEKSARLGGKEINHSESTLSANTYRVFDYPLESPNHGSNSLVTSPYTKFAPAGTGPGSTNGWHNDGAEDYDITKGNNVRAYEDTSNDNVDWPVDFTPSSAELNFDYAYSHGLNTASANQNAAITNLFYWCNLLHDVLYKYGFDEPAGNFQNDNMGRGGLGNDYIKAEAQDGGSMNNAFISIPVDGQSGRMQLGLFDQGDTYDGDGSFDNGVIANLYGQGWSQRLTGGANTVSCLQNVESGAYAWSDYLGLMLTTDWSSLSPNLASANLSRGIGTYVFGQPTNGVGIRPYPYSYDMANVNPLVTYGQIANTAFTAPHGIGSIWTTILWDLTWELILEDNQIIDNIYDVPINLADMRGNVAALKLVSTGLSIQPCSPSFIDARDAILQADLNLFGGRYQCALARAFSRRGLGQNASTGLSSHDRIVTEDFTLLSRFLTSSLTPPAICSNLSFVYEALADNAPPSATLSWTRPIVVGISNSVGAGSGPFINEVLINSTEKPISVDYIFTISEDPCNPTASQKVSVVVNPGPMPLIGAYNVCQNGTVPIGEGLLASESLDTVYNGTIVSDSTYNRSSSNNNSNTYIASGKLCYFRVIPFISPSTGSFSFETTDGSINDTYLSLYQNAFDPSNPATNFLRGDDDSGVGSKSKVTESLVEGNMYFLVASTFAVGIVGSFTTKSSASVEFIRPWTWGSFPIGGDFLSTENVFNPIGVSGSGIADTGTPISKNYYLGDTTYSSCRTRVTFAVNEPTSSSGTVIDTFVCSRNNKGMLFLVGNIGPIKRWESSIDDFVNIEIISNTADSLEFKKVKQDTKFRAVIQNGACPEKNASSGLVSFILPQLFLSSPDHDVGDIVKMFAAKEDLTATNKLNSGAKIRMKAGQSILMDEGFQVEQNATFVAEIEDICATD